MTVRAFGPQSFKVVPRNVGDVTITKADGSTPSFTAGPTVSGGALTFSTDDGGKPLHLNIAVTNASGQVEELRTVLGGPNGAAVVTAGAAAGTGPTALSVEGDDSNIQVGLHAGTSPGTGTLLHVQYAKNQKVTAEPVVSGANDASAATRPSVQNVTAQGYDLVVGVAPAASAVLLYDVMFNKLDVQSGHTALTESVDPSLGASGSMATTGSNVYGS